MRAAFAFLLLPLCLAALGSGCKHSPAALAMARLDSSESVWSCRCSLRSIQVGREEPGSAEVLWVADDRTVSEIRPDGSALEVYKSPALGRILRLEAADLDGDGDSEWVIVTKTGATRSDVLDHGPDGWTRVGKPFSGFLRPLIGADGQVQLVGQRSGGDRPFWGRVFEIEGDAWSKMKPGKNLELPFETSIYDYFWLPNADPAVEGRLLLMEGNGRLSERDPRSPKSSLWRSDGRMVVRPVRISGDYENLFGEDTGQALQLTPPVAVYQQDGRWLALMSAGNPAPTFTMDELQVLQGGDLRVWASEPRGLRELHRSPMLGKATIGGVPWLRGDGVAVWAGAVWTAAPGGFKPPQTKVLLFDPGTGDALAAPPSSDEP